MNLAESEQGSGAVHGFDFHTDCRSVGVDVDVTVYPLDAIYGAAYLFVDRAFLFLTRSRPDSVTVNLRPKEPASEDELERLAGEFANELLNQVLRCRVAEGTGKIREYYMARAFFTDVRRPSIDELLASLEDEEWGDDPLDIRVPWDEKHGRAEDGAKAGDDEPSKGPEGD